MEGAEPPRAPGAASAARRARAAQQGIWLVADVRDELTAIADEQGTAFPEPIPHAT